MSPTNNLPLLLETLHDLPPSTWPIEERGHLLRIAEILDAQVPDLLACQQIRDVLHQSTAGRQILQTYEAEGAARRAAAASNLKQLVNPNYVLAPDGSHRLPNWTPPPPTREETSERLRHQAGLFAATETTSPDESSHDEANA